MKGSEKDTKDGMAAGRGDFVEFDQSNRPLPLIRIDGPYGAPAEDVFNSEVAVLVGAGIGMLQGAIHVIHLSLVSISKVLLRLRLSSSTSGTVKRKVIWVLFVGSNSSGFAATPLLSVGSKACSRKLRLLKRTVSFFLHLIESLADLLTANFLRINIYLTQKISDDMLWNIAVNDAGAEYDPLTLLRTRTMYGRPDWKAIYGRIRMAIESGGYLPGHNSALKSRVGVSVCLPYFFVPLLIKLLFHRHTFAA